MTIEQEKHLARIKANFVIEADSKYRKGQKEHGGDLWAMSLLDLINNALQEAIDQVIYLETAREKLIEEANFIDKLNPYFPPNIRRSEGDIG